MMTSVKDCRLSPFHPPGAKRISRYFSSVNFSRIFRSDWLIGNTAAWGDLVDAVSGLNQAGAVVRANFLEPLSAKVSEVK